MSRLPPVNEKASPDAAAVFAQIELSRGNVSNVLRSFGHAPEGLRAFAAYGEYVRYRTGLDARLRELVILTLARGNQYAWTHHAPFALKEGVTQGELDALNQGELAATFSLTERAAIEYAREFARAGQVRDSTFARGLSVFGARALTDLTLLCGYFIVLASAINAFGIELEPDRPPLMKPIDTPKD